MVLNMYVLDMALFPLEKNSSFISPEIHILMVNLRKDLWNLSGLSSPYWRLYWNFKGELGVNLKDSPVQFKLGRRYLIPPDTEFSSFSKGGIEQCYIHFLVNSSYGSHMGQGKPGIYLLKERAGFDNLFREIVHGIKGRTIIDSRTSQLSASLCSLSLADLPSPALSEPVGDERVMRGAAYIRERLNVPVKAKEIAQAAGVSNKSLERIFMKTHGLTPLQYRKKLRIEQACLMLHFSHKTLDQIADEMGFSDRFHFSRVFTSVRGISPGKYRTMTNELLP